jgi:hypothetical protein
MLPGIPPPDPDEPVTSADGRRESDHRVETDDVKQMVEAGRRLLRENPRLTEAGLRKLMLERFQANDQRLQHDKATMTNGPADPVGGMFSVLMLPWVFVRWLGWRGRLRRHRAEMNEVVDVLRREGHFASGTA